LLAPILAAGRSPIRVIAPQPFFMTSLNVARELVDVPKQSRSKGRSGAAGADMRPGRFVRLTIAELMLEPG
jgi:hypothetical protein